MNRSPEKRGPDSSSFARAMYWGSRASSAAMQFVVPALIGLWVDHRYGVDPWGIVVGAVLGFAVGIRELIRLMQEMDRASNRSGKHRGDS